MSDLRFLCVPCDGIGPEIADATESVLNTLISELGLSIDLEHDLAGFDSLKKYGTTLREELLEKAETDFDGVILGPMSTWIIRLSPMVEEMFREVLGSGSICTQT